jgi:alkanesulfonate monooxygenase SsuD/methylene tetrahydromethanopterin reductase-like flavin-dependent oxidoreductase (luciferase family)
VREGTLICGSPQTVLRQIEAQVGALGINYLVAYMFFGTMSLPDALRSLNLFRSEVMPKL